MSAQALRRRTTLAARQLGLDLKWAIAEKGATKATFELIWTPLRLTSAAHPQLGATGLVYEASD